MLSHHMLQEATRKKLLREAKNQVSYYTKEGKEVQLSQTAEKILENLSAISVMQQEQMEHIPEKVQEKIFSIAGFQKENGKSARVLVEAKNVSEKVHIPSGQRFQVGDLFFETNKDFLLRNNRLIGLFTKYEDKIMDYSHILDEDCPVADAIFTRQPKEKMELYLVMENSPNAGEELIFYVHLAEEFSRKLGDEKNIFAGIQWQIYTKRGFIDLRCKDETGCFITSGELVFHIPKEETFQYEELPKTGYVIRGILKRAEYDIFPKIKKINGFLFEVWQKETHSICHTYSGKRQTIEFYMRELFEEENIQVFCKEKADEGYYLYEKAALEKKGRFYSLENLGGGRYRLQFDKKRFGFAPDNFENAVKLVFYSTEMKQSCELGQLYGYDNQKLLLPLKNVVKESFSIFAMRENVDGENMYYFMRPSSSKKEEINYILHENDGVLEIKDAGAFIDSKIFLAGCTTNEGSRGNIRAGSVLQPLGLETSIQFSNPAAGKGGAYSEDVTAIKRRMKKDLQKHHTAVRAEDYEELVKSIPELCIHKVKAVRELDSNRILIAVKPKSYEMFPKLSEIYINRIRNRLEKVRLLNVDIAIMQPKYVPVQVMGTIYINSYYNNCREQIETIIRQQLDYVTTERNFGERFCFDTLSRRIEALDCVKYIYELSTSLPDTMDAVQIGADIQPNYCCLLYPGEICLELHTME